MIKRNDKIITRKFWQFLFPAFGTAIAISLSEFVDSIVVSQLLGSDAMAIVNIGSPIMLLAASLYAFFGFGGSILYGQALGEKQEAKAKRIFGITAQMAIIASIVIMLIGFAFRAPIAEFISKGSDFYSEVYPYIFYLFASFPLIIIVMSLASFLPAMNHAVLGSSCAIIANIINLIMDYVFIAVLHQGICGAAMATLTGYAVVAIVIIILAVCKKISLPCSEIFKKPIASMVKGIASTGFSDSALQFGFAIAWGFCNTLAAQTGGNDGLVAYSFYCQLASIISIFLAGICGGAMPLFSLLYGANDKQGIRLLTKRASLFMIICALAVVVFFITCPQALFSTFKIKAESQMTLCMSAITTFAILAPFRSLMVLYRIILNTCGHAKMSSVLALFDSVIGILIFSTILTRFFGVRGLWYAYMANVFALLLGIITHNAIQYFKSNRTISPLFLFTNNTDSVLIDSTILDKNDSIEEISKKTMEACLTHGMDSKVSNFTALLVEEMAIYTRNHCGNNQYIDILVQKGNGFIKIDFRSIGKPFNPLHETAEDDHFNIALLNGVSKNISYEYAMGLNTTTLLLNSEA